MTYSACPPTQPPMSTYPYAAPGRAGLTVRQMPVLPSLQLRQRPQAMLNGTETMSPFLMNSHVAPGLDHFAGDLVAEDQPRRRGRAAADHVLVGAADVGRDDLEDRRVVNPFALGIGQFGVLDFVHLDLARPQINDSTILCHCCVLPDGWVVMMGLIRWSGLGILKALFLREGKY